MAAEEFITAAARELAARFGFKVFPVNGQKKPACKGGHKAATDSDQKIQALFKNCRHAEGVAIRTGRCSNILVLDVDSKRTEDLGFDPLDKLIDQFGDDWIDTTRVFTPSGGHHFYFKLDSNDDIVFSSRVGLFDAVDIRCEGGYVVAPPSMVEGKSYIWGTRDEVPYSLVLQPVPAWLIDRMIRSSTRTPDVDKSLVIGKCSFPFLKAVLKDSLHKVRLARKGKRKITLTLQAYRLGMWVPYGLDYALAMSGLDRIAREWKDIESSEIDNRIEPAMEKGISEAYAGKGPSLPPDEAERIRNEIHCAKLKQKWASTLSLVPEGWTSDEILDKWPGWKIAFNGSRKAAKHFLTKAMKARGFIVRQCRVGGVIGRRWFRYTSDGE